MRLLIINYEMDETSAVLAWQARVAKELAQHCDFVAVLTERVGHFEPPPNMYVETLEAKPFGLPRRFGLALLLNRQVWQLCQRYRIDACFIHMAADWAFYFYPSFRLLRIPVLMWYAHGTVTARLRLAHTCVTRVVTSTPEGFRLPSRKVAVIGQGIDTDLFQPPAYSLEPKNDLITIGRVSRRKRIDLLLDVMNCLRRSSRAADVRLRIIGPMLTVDDLNYEAELRRRVWNMGLQDRVDFVGFVPQEHTPTFYQRAFLHINVSRTGSMDKTVLEALACGCPVLTSNEAFREILAAYPEFIINDDHPEAIATQLIALYSQRDQYAVESLRALVVGRHDVHTYCRKILKHLNELRS
jgi:glycosyltransferase involved in cell wall biosynthesis